MRTRLVAGCAAVALATAVAVPTAASASDARARHAQEKRCATEFHAAVVEDNEAYNAKDAARYEAILNPRMIFWQDGNVTYGREAIMATARQSFAVPGWRWTYDILSETVYGCSSGIAVADMHIILADGTDRRFAVSMGLVREHGRWSVAIDNVHLVSSTPPPAP
jgi:hypothetical protein